MEKSQNAERLINATNEYLQVLNDVVALKSQPVHMLEKPLEDSEIEGHVQILRENYGTYTTKEFFTWLRSYLKAERSGPLSPAEKEALLRFASEKLPSEDTILAEED